MPGEVASPGESLAAGLAVKGLEGGQASRSHAGGTPAVV